MAGLHLSQQRVLAEGLAYLNDQDAEAMEAQVAGESRARTRIKRQSREKFLRKQGVK